MPISADDMEPLEAQDAQTIEVGRAGVRPSPPNKADPVMQYEHTGDESTQEPQKSGVALGEKAVMVNIYVPFDGNSTELDRQQRGTK